MNVETGDTATLATGIAGVLGFGDFVVQNRTNGTSQVYIVNNSGVVDGSVSNASITDTYVQMSNFGINLNTNIAGMRKTVNIGYGAITMRDPEYIVSPAVGNTAQVPAAHYDAQNRVLTIFLS